MRQRDYQIEARRVAFAAWERGEPGVLLHGPTGSGKSLVFSKVAEEWHHKHSGRVLVLAWDNRELVEQAAGNLRRHTRLSVGVEMAGQRVNRASLPDAVCASVQTMAARLRDFPFDAFSLLIFDEADHAAAKTWRTIRRWFWKATLLGTTATPVRHDGRRNDDFTFAHQLATHRQLIDAGQIARIRQHAIDVLDLSAVAIPGEGGDIDAATLGRVLASEKNEHEVVASTLRLAGDRPTIVFTATVKNAQALAALFNRPSYRPGSARAVWGAMPWKDRKATLADFEAGKFQFLVNVAVLGRGVDLPFVSCVAMARPTNSATLYEQNIGRGWRAHPGKDDLLVLDFKGSAERHPLVSAVDVLAGKDIDEETKERARERLDEEPGDVLEALDAAAADLIDPAVRERVRAKVRLRVHEVGAFSVSDEEWRTKTDTEIARERGASKMTTGRRRPTHIPSPAKSYEYKREQGRKSTMAWTPEQRRERARSASAALTPERRLENLRKANAALTPEQRSENGRKVNASLTPEQRRERVGKANVSMTPEQRSERTRKANAARTASRRSEIAHKSWATRRAKQQEQK